MPVRFSVALAARLAGSIVLLSDAALAQGMMMRRDNSMRHGEGMRRHDTGRVIGTGVGIGNRLANDEK